MTITKNVFRSKFTKFVTEANEANLVESFNNFAYFVPEEALNLLWCLTYQKDAVPILGKIGIDTEKFSADNVMPLRNELRYQFENANGTFQDFVMAGDKSLVEAFDEFKAQSSDAIVACVVYDHCIQAIYMAGLDRTLFLLSSEKEENYFGGIRSLKFNKAEAEYLKPFHLYIHTLLQKMYETKMGEFKMTKTVPELKVVSEKPSKDVKETKTVTPKAISTPKTSKSKFKPITAEGIINDKGAFAAFVWSYDFDQVYELGYDLNEVMSKRNEIFDLIKAIDAINK